jgi:hypothetical protein
VQPRHACVHHWAHAVVNHVTWLHTRPLSLFRTPRTPPRTPQHTEHLRLSEGTWRGCALDAVRDSSEHAATLLDLKALKHQVDIERLHLAPLSTIRACFPARTPRLHVSISSPPLVFTCAGGSGAVGAAIDEEPESAELHDCCGRCWCGRRRQNTVCDPLHPHTHHHPASAHQSTYQQTCTAHPMASTPTCDN